MSKHHPQPLHHIANPQRVRADQLRRRSNAAGMHQSQRRKGARNQRRREAILDQRRSW